LKKSKKTKQTPKSARRKCSSSRRSSPIPDTSKWLPRDASSSLSAAFSKECANAERRILSTLEHEKNFSIDRYDSGLPFEGIVRAELAKLIPKRYKITDGLVIDRDGKTAGNCDVVIFNELWFSPIKSPQAQDAGKLFFPIEGVYAIGEIKQSISESTLDEAMKKLIICHRLQRPRTYAHRIVENREGSECKHGLTNPLFSFILAGSIANGTNFERINLRFFEISKTLKRLEIITVLCILNVGAISWGFKDPLRNGEVRPALFLKDDLFHNIFPVLSSVDIRSPLLHLIQTIQLSLYHTILGPEDIATAYGFDNRIKIPANPDITIPPDDEWKKLLEKPCSSHHEDIF